MPSERGLLYLVAGNSDPARARGPDPLVQLAIQRTGTRRPRVAYIGAASGDDAVIRERNVVMLKRAGAGSVILAPLAGRRINAAVAARIVETSDLVFMSGGDVGAGMGVLEARGLVPFLRGTHRAGMPFLGVSAGSIMLSRAWVRWDDPNDDESAELFPCLGLARICCDAHGERDGWSELKAMLALRPVGTPGYGIVSGSAIVVEADGSLSAFGGEVHVFRRRKTGVVQVQSLTPGPRLGA
jgi:cyanophycinase-like exopeptidase